MKFYDIKKLIAKKCSYNIVFGERSNGKTYSALMYGIEKYLQDGGQIAIVRRWKEDIIGKRASEIFSAIIANDEITKLTQGKFSGIYYWNGRYYLCTYDEDGKPVYNLETDCIGFTFALSDNEHNKSISFPKVTTIIFDEFITKHVYLQDEFVLFMNTVSTIVRQRTDVTIIMLGNTVNKFCPYFDEMGLNNVLKMKQGTIDIYTYGDSELKVGVEYCSSMESQKKNNFYFAFNNPKLSMITSGVWELDMYPHLPMKYTPKQIVFTYFIVFNDSTYQCEIISVNGDLFTFIHDKTTHIKDRQDNLIYSLDYNVSLCYNRNILKPINELQKKVLWFFANGRVFYQNNSIGNAIENYLKLCKRGV